MNQREAKRMICEAAAATLGFAGENDWICSLRDGSPRTPKDIERLSRAWRELVSELAARAGTTEHT